MATTNPDNIYYLVTGDPSGLIPYSATLATSVQEALNSRDETQQLRTYRWADETEQGAQAGMSPGDTGYREDLDIMFQWNGATWRELTPGLNLLRPTSVTGGTVSPAGKISFSASSGVSVDGVFSERFDRYQIIFSATSSVSAGMNMNLRSGGTTNTANAYYRRIMYLSAPSTPSGAEGLAGNVWGLGLSARTSFHADITIYNPFLTSRTVMEASGLVSDTDPSLLATYVQGSIHSQSASFDGFNISPSTGTITGSLCVYGYYQG